MSGQKKKIGSGIWLALTWLELLCWIICKTNREETETHPHPPGSGTECEKLSWRHAKFFLFAKVAKQGYWHPH